MGDLSLQQQGITMLVKKRHIPFHLASDTVICCVPQTQFNHIKFFSLNMDIYRHLVVIGLFKKRVHLHICKITGIIQPAAEPGKLISGKILPHGNADYRFHCRQISGISGKGDFPETVSPAGIQDESHISTVFINIGIYL